MLRTLLALLLLTVVPASAAAVGKKKPVKKRPGPYGPNSRVVRAAEAHGAASLRVRSIDFGRRIVVVELGGFPKAPAGNLFTFSDDRGRKFIAVSASCEEPFPSGIRVCDLGTPEGYERHPWVGLELHLHGLQSGTVAAPREGVERAYEAAKILAEAAAPAEADDGDHADKPVEAKPVEGKPVEGKPAEEKPAEEKPAEAKKETPAANPSLPAPPPTKDE